MVDLASLVVRLVADTSRYSRDLDRAGNQLNNFANVASVSLKKVALVAAGAAVAIAAPMIALAKSAIDAADEMNDLAKQTGIATEALSELQYAAEQSGSDLEGLTTGLRKFVTQIADAASGTGDAAKSFALIGVSVKDAAGNLKPTEQLLLDVAERFSQYKDGAAKAAFAQDLFGKSGAALIPFLNEGRSGIERLMKEANALGLTLSGNLAQGADDFNDSLNKLNRQLDTFGLQIAERAVKPLTAFTEAISDLIKERKNMSGFLDSIDTGLRAVGYIAISVADLIDDVGKLLGGFAAYTVLVVQGKIDQANKLEEEFKRDAIAREEATNKALEKIWNDRATNRDKILGPRRMGSYLTDAQRQAAANTPYFKKPDFPTPKEIADPLQEVEITLKRVEIAEDVYADLESNTQTALETAFVEFNKRKAQLNILRDDGELLKRAQGNAEVAAQIYKERLTAFENEMLGVLTKGARVAEEESKKINEFQLQAARNTQDIIADTFVDLATGADISAKSILKSFGRMIIQLAAQAAAANLAQKLFGESAGGAKGSAGLIGTALSALGFGGARDSGGRGRAGMAYAIGKGAQPELFIPDRPGTFMPAGSYGGATTNNFTIVAEEPLSRRTQLQIAAAASRGVERANRRNN